MTWTTSDLTAAAAVVIALASFAFSLVQHLRAKHEALVKALQGNKESVGFIAFKLSNENFPWRARPRKDILTALCLAAIFEDSGRSRTLIYKALKKAMEAHGNEVTAIINDIEKHVFESVDESKLEKGRKRLKQLKHALRPGKDETAGQA